jgi:hypothetical protein
LQHTENALATVAIVKRWLHRKSPASICGQKWSALLLEGSFMAVVRMKSDEKSLEL